MTATKRYQINPVVSCGEEADGAILFNPDTDDTAAINTSGLLLWNFLETPRTAAEMSDYLVEQFRDVSDARALEDVSRFVEILQPDFLVEIGHGK